MGIWGFMTVCVGWSAQGLELQPSPEGGSCCVGVSEAALRRREGFPLPQSPPGHSIQIEQVDRKIDRYIDKLVDR